MKLTATIKMSTEGKIYEDEVARMKPKVNRYIAFFTIILCTQQ